MRRAALVACAFVLVATSCILRSSPQGAADELTMTANRVGDTTYAAVYRFSFTRQFAPGISTRMEIIQQPPTSVRKVQTTTRPEEGDEVTLTAWYITNAEGDFVCTEYEAIGVRCQTDPIVAATFGTSKLDVFFDTPRRANAFSSVRKASRSVRIQGQPGACFEAVPAPPSPAPGTPEPSPERFRYELCYADDGVLLRGRRTALDEGAGGTDVSESFVELVSLSRVVEAGELRLPGPVTDPTDLPR